MSLSLDALRAEVERLRAEVREAEERQAAGGGSAARIDDDDEEAAEDDETAAASPFFLPEPQWLATNRIAYSNGDVYEASRSALNPPPRSRRATHAHDARHHAPHAWRLQDNSRFRVHRPAACASIRHTDHNMYGRLFPLRALLSGEATVVPCSATAVAAHTAAPRATYTTETGAWTCGTARGA